MIIKNLINYAFIYVFMIGDANPVYVHNQNMNIHAHTCLYIYNICVWVYVLVFELSALDNVKQQFKYSTNMTVVPIFLPSFHETTRKRAPKTCSETPAIH